MYASSGFPTAGTPQPTPLTRSWILDLNATLRDTIAADHFLHNFGRDRRGLLVGEGKCLYPFGKLISYNQYYLISSISLWKRAQDITCYSLHGSSHNVLLQCSLMLSQWWSTLAAGPTLSALKSHICRMPRPIISPTKPLKGLRNSKVSRSHCCVCLFQDFQTNWNQKLPSCL